MIRPIGVMILLVGVAAFAAAADLASAKRDFGIFCSNCHGPGGKGDGPQAATLSTKPRDLTDCARMKAIEDATLFTAIKEGGEAVKLSKDMPAWKDGMDDDEIHGLVAFVRSLCTR